MGEVFDHEEAAPDRRQAMLDRLARAVSTATSPYVVTGIMAALAVLILQPTWNQLLLWGSIAICTGAIFPFLIVYLLWRKHRLTDMHVRLRSQRLVPFAAALVSASAGMALLYVLRAPAQLVALAAVYVANGVILALISLHWKISVHAAVYTAGVMSLWALGYVPALWALALLPLVLWARVRRHRHTWLQGLVPVALSLVLTPAVYLAVSGMV